MNEDQPPGTRSLPLSQELRVNVACDRFEKAWKDGQRPRMEEYLAEVPEPERVPLFGELLALEIELRSNDGDKPTPEEYHWRFGEHIELINAVFANLPSGADSAPPGAGEGATTPYTPPTGISAVDSGPSLPSGSPLLPDHIGRYQVVRRLGGGTFGDVYLAHDGVMDRPVAVKVPSAWLVATERAREEFLREARSVARLDCEGIVRAYDAGQEQDGRFYIVYEFVDGENLAQRIKPERIAADPLPPEKATRIVAHVAQAVHYAHLQGMVHRDIKPSNILLDRTGKPYLADFGLALREEDFGKGYKYLGTPDYMSPEQARGEGHRVDGRSDIFSLGVVFYELLTERKPFRADSPEELRELIATVEPRPLRQIDDDIPKELERICLIALAKRASERYTTALDLADDLLHFLEENSANQPSPSDGEEQGYPRTPAVKPLSSLPPCHPADSAMPSRSGSTDLRPLRIVPKGLRSFDAHDADFFLELLPGPRDREGLPDSIRFWKTRIEEADADQTFAVGLIYGPSGCGKSSLVKAGLLPRLTNQQALAVYVEATAGDTERRLLKGLRKACPDLPNDPSLAHTLAALRRGKGNAPRQKVVIVLDQLEQWLHGCREEETAELVRALRQCDGRRVQCLLLVRDDFWLAVSRFMQALEVRVVEGENSRLVDLFDLRHARKILVAFGRALGALPEGARSKEQDTFLDQAVAGLAQEGKVVPVRLALFAEMVKGKPWTPPTLRQVGGTKGVGVTFLDETFSAANAPPQHRLHQKAAQAVLQALLPDPGTDIKGHMRARQDLLEASGYANRPQDFAELIRILDSELRLITPTDPEGKGEAASSSPPAGKQYYQLTHDYLVPSLRAWLNRKQKETRCGRAQQRLSERASLWQAKPEPRQLPSLTEWCAIRLLTAPRTWTEPERQMMRAAGRKHLAVLTSVAAAAGLLVCLVLFIRGREAENRAAARANDLVSHLLDANIAKTPAIIDALPPYRPWANPLLEKVAADPAARPGHQLRARLALLPEDARHADPLRDELLKADLQDFMIIRHALAPHTTSLASGLWDLLEKEAGDPRQRFRAAAALADYDPANPRWKGAASWVASQLVGQPSLELARWVEALGPVRDHLIPVLRTHFRAAPTPVAAAIIGDYAADQPDVLADALGHAPPDSFAVLFPLLARHQDRAVQAVAASLHRAPQDRRKDPNPEAARRANLAIALLRLGAAERLWPMLKATRDPRCRSFLIDRMGPLGCEPVTLLDRLGAEPEESVRAALLLGLGWFRERVLSARRRAELAPRIAQIYRTAGSAAVHAAAGWLLGKWGQRPEERPSEKGPPDDGRGWYVNGAGITMVQIVGPGQFLMGAPPGEIGADDREKQHTETLDYDYEIGMTEVTVEQIHRFLRESRGRDKGPPMLQEPATPEDAPITKVTWYDAVAYCDWLNRLEGIQRDQWCYLPAQDGTFKEGMKIVAGYHRLRGYRLPTEAEWEYACRGKATTSRCYGDANELLRRYAWYGENAGDKPAPVARLLPNAFGLFDMHGNTGEWCQNIARRYADGRKDVRADEVVSTKERRAIRGGHIFTYARWVRSAKRFSDPPTSIDAGGFRIVRSRPRP
jgi:serine/threonine protein kinase/formylglycine-generating enzyme required for sulfatase activity